MQKGNMRECARYLLHAGHVSEGTLQLGQCHALYLMLFITREL
jgi:hypothetical protein